jgi:hypothetical protein
MSGIGLTQNYEKTNRKERKEREGKRVSKSSCVSPMENKLALRGYYFLSLADCKINIIASFYY